MSQYTRNYSLDLLKILSCMLVVMMHTLRHFDENVNLHPILYYMTRCSMPLFFMAAGAIQLNKKYVDFHYCLQKIEQIFFVMVGYYFCDLLIRIIIIGRMPQVSEIVMIIKSLYWDFGVFWFLRTMIVIYFILPILHYVYNKNSILLVSILVLICACVDLASVINIELKGAQTYLQQGVMQEFRYWTWIMYYCLGGGIYANYAKFKINDKMLLFGVVSSCAVAISYMLLMLKVKTNIVNGEYAYDSLFMILWSSLTMIFLLRVTTRRFQKIIMLGTSLLIPVFALHVFIIRIFDNFSLFQSYLMQLVGYVCILAITALIGYIMTRIPMVKRFTYIG